LTYIAAPTIIFVNLEVHIREFGDSLLVTERAKQPQFGSVFSIARILDVTVVSPVRIDRAVTL